MTTKAYFSILILLLCLAMTCLAQDNTPTPTPSCTPTPAIPSPTPTCTPYNFDCGGVYINYDEDTVPAPSPSPTALPSAFQPPGGSTLMWRQYVPSGTGPFPTVLIIHGGGFHAGDLFEQGQEQASAYPVSRGYFVVSITHRLAPCGHITGQDPTDPTSGRPPNQTNDVKSAIRAVHADPHCNGHIGLLGGSSGAAHALFCAFDKTPSLPNTYPNWCNDSPTDDDRPDCAVGLSGHYDFISPGGNNATTRNVIANYTNTCVLLATMGGPDQFSVSPVAQLKPESVQSFKPIYALNGDMEYQPVGQLQDLLCALQGKGIDPAKYKILTVIDPDKAHAFALWRVFLTPTSTRRVRDEVTDFFDQYVKHAQ